uniref:RRM_2 domain-containing protein n=1 Tax=Strongyloides papillosus TaxID=174720 RepID=A0A0N5B8X1_STREA
MISNVNPYVIDRKTQNRRCIHDEAIPKPDYPVDNYLFNLIECTRKFTNEPVLGSTYVGRYFKPDNSKQYPRENDRNRQKKYHRNNNGSMKNNNDVNYFPSQSRNTNYESEKEKQIRNLFSKNPYTFKPVEKTSKKNVNDIIISGAQQQQQPTVHFIRPDQLPIHKLLKITYDKKFNNACYIPAFLREPSVEAMEAMNNVLYGNMFYVDKKIR